jgi:hypothetical protein
MIAPHRGQRREPTQDGHPLRRYRRRWRVERLFAWLHHFRRLVIRWEYHVQNFFGMVRLGCIQILLRQLWGGLLVPQRHHGIDLRSPPRWQERRQHCNRRQNYGNDCEY